MPTDLVQIQVEVPIFEFDYGVAVASDHVMVVGPVRIRLINLYGTRTGQARRAGFRNRGLLVQVQPWVSLSQMCLWRPQLFADSMQNITRSAGDTPAPADSERQRHFLTKRSSSVAANTADFRSANAGSIPAWTTLFPKRVPVFDLGHPI